MALFDQLAALQALGRPLLVGPSRKRFLGAITGLPVEERDRATAAACALAWERGARLFRVHAVAAAREALAIAQALEAPARGMSPRRRASAVPRRRRRRRRWCWRSTS